MSDEHEPGVITDDPAVRSVLALVLAVSGLGVVAALFMRWIEAGALGDADGKSALVTVPLLVPAALGALAALVAAVLAALGMPASRVVAIVAAALMLAPSALVVVVTEAVQAALPTWLAPVLTNSDFLSFRAGTGAWIALSAGIVMIVAATSIDRIASLVEDRRDRRSAFAAPLVAFGASVALIVLRARPVVVAAVDGLDSSIADAAASIGDITGDETGLTDRVVDTLGGTDIDGASQVRIVLGDLPLVGLVSFVAVIVLAVAATLVLLRPRAVWPVLAGASAGVLLFCHWLVAAVIEVGNAILPDSWLEVGDGQLVVAADTSDALRWATLWATGVFVALVVSVVTSEGVTPGYADDEDPEIVIGPNTELEGRW
ncbi:MAG: hypothetical protein ACO307_06960 [Ilumatobacteraceae bacterium]